ncbi:adenylate/guanylate cyclase catalytic domain protein [Leptospira weilii serovar Ranarum str. ICFT]|uniref:Adenylate/guanylate cyclase catalytic domain protein n=1 Tax=Leptospira weilii serovar Ranarum str. ICFT TaxID=1218598 RepID=N1WB58_9LEPT|nr:adenylate/guanylate cyclase catalytic domain protein [Leptospira weilii serovar Ranarum str. ICFT]
MDLTHAEWSASLGNHLKNKLEKSNIQNSFLKNKKEKTNIETDLKEKEPKNSENWKSIPSFPVSFNSLFEIPDQSGFHDVTVKVEFSVNSELIKSPTAIYFPDIGENWELYLNDVLVRKERFPKRVDNNDLTPSIRRSLKSVILPIPSGALKEGKNTIFLYMVGESNLTSYFQNDHFGFYHTSGYKISPIQKIYESTSEYFEVFLYGIYFIFGIYHVFFYAIRRQDLYYIYFGFLSFVSSVYFFSSSNLIFQKFVNPNSEIDSSHFFRIEYSSLTLILPAFYYFLKDYFYQKEKTNVVPTFFLILLVGLFFAILVVPFSWIYAAVGICQISMIFFSIYILFFAIQTVRKKRKDARTILAGISVCIVFAVWDLSDSVFKIVGPHYSFFKIVYLLFIVAIVRILISRYIQLYKDAQLLNTQLSSQKDAFYRFVPVEFIRILDNESPVSISIGNNKEKSMTVLCSDIWNFTNLAETIPSSRTIAFLNSYLSEMEELVYKTAGFVDKYMGDAILALFADYNDRAEKENFNSADNAVESAIKMVSAVRSAKMRKGLSTEWNLEIGIGINTGSLILGTVGSQRRIDTTVIGDAVDLASSLQSLTSLYQSRILISHHTYLRLHNMSEAGIRMIDSAYIKGRNRPVDIYEVFESDPEEIKKFKLKTSDLLSQGILEYKSGKFDEAAKIFKQLYREEPGDNLSKIYLKRCKLYSSKPPEENWDGIFRFQSK